VILESESSLLTPEEHVCVPDPVISIQGVSKRFGDHVVLDDITFDVPRGKTSAILGPSGTGKSVLLKVIIGLLTPEAGQVYIDGEPMVGVREKEILRIRRKIGVLFQDGALFGSMSLFDNIAFPLIEHTNKTERDRRSSSSTNRTRASIRSESLISMVSSTTSTRRPGRPSSSSATTSSR
jgi:ABC-type transporter Mla maintaining outer membrane lipid asymmetry ATPase subunit MlaF